ncbi:hypothetical protein NC651_034194 [Populus alba x Populus x berolinensis]|nr:hypothetical protein NC651_034194 [Populus alba x Populus x berolinensis]
MTQKVLCKYGARAAVWENLKDNPLFDISTEHLTTYYEDMQ